MLRQAATVIVGTAAAIVQMADNAGTRPDWGRMRKM
jgi:hypothetical protein